MRLTIHHLLILAFIFALRPSAIATEPLASSSINPALIYWQAISLLADISPSEAVQLGKLTGNIGAFDTSAATEILTPQNAALKRFSIAAQSPAKCDWGLTYKDGPSMPLPHLAKMQLLCRLALLKAELLFSEQRDADAIDWLMLVHRAARHCGSDELLIPCLVQFSTENAAIRIAALHVLDWDTQTRLNYQTKTSQLPPLLSVKAAMNGELQFIDWVERLWLSNDDVSEKEFEKFLSKANSSEEQASTSNVAHQYTTENIKRWAEELRQYYKSSQAAMDKPWLQSYTELRDLKSAVSKENVLMKLISPSFAPLNEITFKTSTYRTMLNAAIEQGPIMDDKKLESYVDSFEGNSLIHLKDAINRRLWQYPPNLLVVVSSNFR